MKVLPSLQLHSKSSASVTLFTDFAMLMPKIVGSTTTVRVEKDENRMSYISHILNTVIRHVMEALYYAGGIGAL